MISKSEKKIKKNAVKPIDSKTIEIDGLQHIDSEKRAFITTLKEFLSDTSLHGVKHISKKIKHVEDDETYIKHFRALLNNVFWFFLTISSGIFSLHMMNLVWIRYQTTPTVTTIETLNYPIWEVPFPAVTVCNINKVHLPNTKKLREVM